MSMFVWPDDTVTGSVDVAELEAIQKAMKGVGKRKLAALPWPIESAEQLADALAGITDDDEAEPVKATTVKAPKVDSKAEADTAEALSKVDLPKILAKATKKEKS